MSGKNYLYGVVIACMMAVVCTLGCSRDGGGDPTVFFPIKTTGGGFIEDDEGYRANFGFNAAQCAEEEEFLEGHFNYHDKNAEDFQPGGVKMNGEVMGFTVCDDNPLTTDCICTAPSGEMLVQATVEYRSTNPKMKGEGTAFACVVDRGEGSNEEDPGDEGIIEVMDGPFGGYMKMGEVQGNIQAHTCTCTDGEDNDGDGLVDEDDPSCVDPVTGEFDPNADEE
jgi:hypothetical protein